MDVPPAELGTVTNRSAECQNRAMHTSPAGRLISVGYEGRSADELVMNLTELGVSVLVDVRLNPISRKKGLSKSGLATTLAEAGILYVHHRELGNPKNNRDGLRSGDPASVAIFDGLLDGLEARAAIRHVSELLEDEVVALLCFERDHSQCHRAVVTRRITRVHPGVQVTRV